MQIAYGGGIKEFLDDLDYFKIKNIRSITTKMKIWQFIGIINILLFVNLFPIFIKVGELLGLK